MLRARRNLFQECSPSAIARGAPKTESTTQIRAFADRVCKWDIGQLGIAFGELQLQVKIRLRGTDAHDAIIGSAVGFGQPRQSS
jgi:hypothetical protein